MRDICKELAEVMNDHIIATCTLTKMCRALEAKDTYSDQDRAMLQWVYALLKALKDIEDECSYIDFGGEATFMRRDYAVRNIAKYTHEVRSYWHMAIVNDVVYYIF